MVRAQYAQEREEYLDEFREEMNRVMCDCGQYDTLNAGQLLEVTNSNLPPLQLICDDR